MKGKDNNIKKYILLKNENDGVKFEHHDYCLKKCIPYITALQIGTDYTEIFYDITDTQVDHEAVSKKIEKFYKGYLSLTEIPKRDIQKYFDMPYLFEFLVLRKDALFILDIIFDYLKTEMNKV